MHCVKVHLAKDCEVTTSLYQIEDTFLFNDKVYNASYMTARALQFLFVARRLQLKSLYVHTLYEILARQRRQHVCRVTPYD